MVTQLLANFEINWNSTETLWYTRKLNYYLPVSSLTQHEVLEPESPRGCRIVIDGEVWYVRK